MIMINLKSLAAVAVISYLQVSTGIAQTGPVPGNEHNLYAVALADCASDFEESSSRFDDSEHGARARTDYRDLIVERSEITDKLPTQFGDSRIEYLDDQALIDRFKTLKKEFMVLVIHPLENDSTHLAIRVTYHWVGYRRGRLLFGIDGESDYEFVFDCGKQEFVLGKVTRDGV
jgi:hypothetical protein